MKKSLLSLALAIVAIAGASTQASAQTAPVYAAKPFTVAEGKQITFSGGNLQYTQSTLTWSFAEHQYDMLGTDNVTEGTESYDATDGYSKSGSALADKIDLFGWSGSTGSAKWGISTSQSASDYSGDFVDWGTNTIGTDASNTWRTLSKDEWHYLCYTRTNADNLVGVARINLNADGSKYVNGLVLLPDNWTCPAGITFKSGFSDADVSVQAYTDYQTFTLSDWQKLESAGAVFLPASGSRGGSDVGYVQNYGFYWSATSDGSDGADEFGFSSGETGSGYISRYVGRAVRLVKDYSEVNTGIVNPSAENVTIHAENGRIVCDGDILIFDLLGRDVTRMNGSLNGVYVVKCGETAQKIAVR